MLNTASLPAVDFSAAKVYGWNLDQQMVGRESKKRQGE